MHSSMTNTEIISELADTLISVAIKDGLDTGASDVSIVVGGHPDESAVLSVMLSKAFLAKMAKECANADEDEELANYAIMAASDITH